VRAEKMHEQSYTSSILSTAQVTVASQPIIVALDFADTKALRALVDQLSPALCRLKIGKEVFTREGPRMVEQLMHKGFEVFLDLKFHDIPTTVAKACVSAAELGVWMMNVHALGGRRMMREAVERLEPLSGKKPFLIAVTLLTSMSDSDFSELHLMGTLKSNVLRLASLAKESRLQGVVASAEEAAAIKAACGRDFLVVTPGIRLETSPSDDQSRTMTPLEALKQGADFLVIGRPITQSANPLQTLEAIHQSIQTFTQT